MQPVVTKNRLGFSLKGLIILLLVLLPNLLFYAFAINGTAGTAAVFANRVEIISYIERVSQVLLMLVLIFRVNKSSPSLQSRYVFGMAVFLLLYYALWIRYFAGGMDYTLISGTFFVFMGMSVFPSVYFALAEKWLGDHLGVGIAITFGVFHTLNTYLNFAA